MYTSGNHTRARRTLLVYLAAAAFCLLFHLIYARFAHGVSSPYMTYLFLIPLLGGAVPAMLIGRFSSPVGQPGRFSFNCWNSGVAALCAWSLLRGILDIAGTDSSLLVFLCAMGLGFLFLAMTGYAARLSRRARVLPGEHGNPFGPER